MTSSGDSSLERSAKSLPIGRKQGAKPTIRLSNGEVIRPKPAPSMLTTGAVDICFVFDTTGSMSDKIDGLVRCMVTFVDELSKLRLDWRITTVPFGDLTVPGDRIVETAPFVTKREAAEHMLRTMPRFSGGGNLGESSLEAVLAALGKPYRAEAVLIVVVLTDEPPLETAQLNFGTVGRALTAKSAICFVASPALPGFQRWAGENGGEWYPIGQTMDTTKLLDYLRSLVKDVARVAKAVHEVGGGSVKRYLENKRRNENELPTNS